MRWSWLECVVRIGALDCLQGQNGEADEEKESNDRESIYMETFSGWYDSNDGEDYADTDRPVARGSGLSHYIDTPIWEERTTGYM